MNRQHFVFGFLCLLISWQLLGCSKIEPEKFPSGKTKEEWKALLPNDSYGVLFQGATEFPFSSPLDKETREGTYICAACHQPLFESRTKYDSGTGWPSFFDPIPGALETKYQYSLISSVQKEYHCSRCGGHHGHIFYDGPGPTYRRYCSNGVALRFIPKGEKLPELR